MLIMENWRRVNGTTWTRHLGKFRAEVALSKGGWYWMVIWQDGTVVETSSQPTSRRRKARRESQRVLLALAAAQPVIRKMAEFEAAPTAAV